jgi:YfiH family protein
MVTRAFGSSGPALVRGTAGRVVYWIDEALRASAGVVVAFSERGGGWSSGPFATLNLAAHVGDEPEAVDANRSALLEALGMGELREHLTMAEQVHGSAIAVIDRADAGSGAWAARGKPPVAATDALLTRRRGVPIALCFADCVPVVLAAPGPCVAVVHAGWRGALASLPGAAVTACAQSAGCATTEIFAYVGAHIGACHYQVDEALMSQFVNSFGTFARAESGGLDLGAVVTASLSSAGVASCNIAPLGICTAEATDRFFSYRAEAGATGRHAALACIF